MYRHKPLLTTGTIANYKTTERNLVSLYSWVESVFILFLTMTYVKPFASCNITTCLVVVSAVLGVGVMAQEMAEWEETSQLSGEASTAISIPHPK